MNIAAQHGNASAVKQDRVGGCAAVELELEGLGCGKGIDVVAHRIPVGKADHRADGHHRDAGLELFGDLRDLHRRQPGRAQCPDSLRRFKKRDSVAQQRAAGVLHLYSNRGRLRAQAGGQKGSRPSCQGS